MRLHKNIAGPSWLCPAVYSVMNKGTQYDQKYVDTQPSHPHAGLSQPVLKLETQLSRMSLYAVA